MRKTLLLALLIIIILPTYSQTSVGVIGGYNLATYHPRHYDFQYSNSEYSYRSAWRAGLITDHHLWKKLYLQPQLLLNAKGTNHHDSYTDQFPQEISTSTRLLYLELQTHFIVKEQLGKGQLIVGAGPYLGRGIRGKNTAKGYIEVNGEKSYFDTEANIKFRNKVPPPISSGVSEFAYFKPYDAGLNFQIGYELKNGLFFNTVYSLGLTNLFHYSEGYKPKNTYFGLSVGYFFKKFS